MCAENASIPGCRSRASGPIVFDSVAAEDSRHLISHVDFEGSTADCALGADPVGSEGIPNNLKVCVLPNIEEQPSSSGVSNRGLARIIHEEAVLDTDFAAAVGGNAQRTSEGVCLTRADKIVSELAVENVQVVEPESLISTSTAPMPPTTAMVSFALNAHLSRLNPA